MQTKPECWPGDSIPSAGEQLPGRCRHILRVEVVVEDQALHVDNFRENRDRASDFMPSVIEGTQGHVRNVQNGIYR